jgi:hypothetical protein
MPKTVRCVSSEDPMKITIRYAVADRLKRAAALRQTTVEVLTEEWLAERLDQEAVDVAPQENAVKCLAPFCDRRYFVRGLCARHYARFRYLVQAGVPEGYLVLRKRVLPSRGMVVADYLDGDPGNPPSPDPETLWFFGRESVAEPRG